MLLIFGVDHQAGTVARANRLGETAAFCYYLFNIFDGAFVFGPRSTSGEQILAVEFYNSTFDHPHR